MTGKTRGLVAATFTPMTADGAIAPSAIPQYAKHLRASGVAGIFVNGSSGEGVSLSVAERIELAEAWRAEAGGLKFLVHVGAHSIPDARALAAHAQAIGADGIACVAPSFFRPGPAALAGFLASIASAAPETPFYFYHMPGFSGVDLSVADLLPALKAAIPNFAGVKFTSLDLCDYSLALRAHPDLDLLYGKDEQLLAALACGAQGAVGTLYNFAPRPFLDVIAAWNRGDLPAAREAMERGQKLVRALVPPGLPAMACFKAAVAILAGIDCGPVRLPNAPLAPGQFATLRASLEAWRDKC